MLDPDVEASLLIIPCPSCVVAPSNVQSNHTVPFHQQSTVYSLELEYTVQAT